MSRWSPQVFGSLTAFSNFFCCCTNAPANYYKRSSSSLWQLCVLSYYPSMQHVLIRKVPSLPVITFRLVNMIHHGIEVQFDVSQSSCFFKLLAIGATDTNCSSGSFVVHSWQHFMRTGRVFLCIDPAWIWRPAKISSTFYVAYCLLERSCFRQTIVNGALNCSLPIPISSIH